MQTSTSSRLLPLALLACAGGLLGLASANPQPEPALLALLAVGCLALEAAAASLGNLGFVSGAGACYLAAALSPQVGYGWALLLSLGALGLRTLLRGQGQGSWRVMEGLVDLVPVTLACLVGLGLGWLWASPPAWAVALIVLEVYLPAALGLPGLLAAGLPLEERPYWARCRRAVTPLVVASAFLGVAGAKLSGLGPWQVLWIAPVAVALATQVARSLDEVELADRQTLAAELESVRRGKAREQAQGDRLRRELQSKVDEYLVVEELSLELAGSHTVDECLAVVLEKLAHTVDCQSLAIFVPEDEQLVPLRFRSPFQTQLAEARLLRSREPLVEQCQQSGRLETLGLPEPAERLFPGETVAVALPIEGFGVLYAGRRGDPFGSEQLRLLVIAATQTSVAVRSASRLESQQQALDLLEQANARLEEWSGGLARLIEGTRLAAVALDPDALLELLPQEIAKLAPHHSLVVLTRDRRGAEYEHLSELIQAVGEGGRPLRFDDLEGARFAPISQGERSLLAIPFDESGMWLLGHRQVGAFGQDQQDLLVLLSYQAGAALQTARAHKETTEAYRLLQESKAQLFQSSKMAAVGQLAAGVAHELNTPLGSTILAIEAAEMFMEMSPDSARDKLSIALREALRAKEIIHKMLYYSRDARYGRRSVDLGKVIADTLGLNQHQFSLDGIELASELQDVPTIHCNENEIQQVLLNLLLNARDAVVGRPGARVVLATRQQGDRAILEVRDNGPGIGEEEAERIFEPFFTTKPVGRGTGLGLSVSRQIVESHQGELVLAETSPTGSTFRVSLPLND
ncbi:MAG: sensor histidine kinase [Vulcanimicrobiota bacterium]